MKSQAVCIRWLWVLIVFISACKADPTEMISRKWHPVDANGANINSDMRKNIVKKGNVLEFSKSGEFTSYTEGEEPEQGTYMLQEDAKHITITRADGYETQMKVVELHPSKLVLETNGVTIVLEPLQ